MKIRVLPSAVQDLAKGRDFYESQAEGLGEYFLNSLLSDIDSLSLHAGVHRKISGFHRLLSARFPFAVYYRLGTEGVEVWRVLDSRQHPNKIKRYLRNPSCK